MNTCAFPPAEPIHRVADIRRLEEAHLPGAEPPLMERAGAGVAALACRLLAEHPGTTVVLAGPGNNGGDGFVAARLLRAAGRPVQVAFAGDEARLPADARAALEAFRHQGGTLLEELPQGAEPALAIDALFGIGLQRPLGGRYGEWVDWLNARTCPVLSIDIPSGLDADTGQVLGCAVRASHTVTFMALKPGLLTAAGPDHCGEITVDAIGLPAAELARTPGSTVAPALFAERLAPRPRNGHKGLYGDAGIVGGAAGMVGAALLAGRAALKLGAGRVYVGLIAAEALAVDPLQPELMLRPGAEVLERASALALGPGLGQSETALALLRAAIARPVPLLLDADALNLIALHPVLAHALARRETPALITPHPAEAARLLGRATAVVQADRVAAALELARRLRCIALLKGAGSVIATPPGRWYINRTGNPGMASAGMGDTLAGMAVALLAQHWEAEQALLAAVHLHGAAGDALAAAGEGPIGLAAGELIEPARRAFNRWIDARR
jgi:hydroxyethylthiazole kinase-like uncharacterized protein yjeF